MSIATILASYSPAAPIIWLGIIIGVVGAGVWQQANAAGRPRWRRITRSDSSFRRRD